MESNEPIYTWKSNGIEKKLDHIYIYKDLDNQQSIVTSAEPAVNFYYNQSGFTDHTMLPGTPSFLLMILTCSESTGSIPA